MGTRIPEGRTERPHTEKLRANRVQGEGSGGLGKNQGARKESAAPKQDHSGAKLVQGAAKEKPPTAPGNNPHISGTASKSVFPKRENITVEAKSPFLNATQQKIAPENPMEVPGKNAALARELFKHIAQALGLPQDNLSVTLIAFLRFFSLSPDVALLKSLRRDILASRPSSPETAEEKAALEAESLAELIAFDKGVKLSGEALKRYARYHAPGFFEGEGRKDGATESPPSDGEPSREDIPGAVDLKALAEEEAAKEGFLDILNSLPGKSGKKWTVFPFNIIVKGTEFSIFLRLLNKEPLLKGDSESVIADIIGPKKKWRWSLHKREGRVRADIRVYPGLSDKALASLQKDAEHFLGKSESVIGMFSGFEEIRVRNGGEAPSWMEDLYDESLPSIDEEV